jgi:hypothetical protein
MPSKVLTINNELIPATEAVILATGEYLHAERDAAEYGTDEITGLNWPIASLTRAFGEDGNLITCARRNTVQYNGSRYHRTYLEDNGLCQTAEGDIVRDCDAYFWASDGQNHSRPEEPARGSLWDYSAGPKERDMRNGARYGFGVEIEKNELPTFPFVKEEVYNLTGAVLERDGSVSNGFELKTPIYDLFGKDTEARLKAFEPYCNIPNNNNAGGHIGFSIQGKTDEQTLYGIRGFLPLIYAMYPNRTANSYCTAKPVDRLLRDREKMQAVNLRGNYIEFRIFPAVWSYNTLLFRFRLMQQIAKKFGRSLYAILLELVTDGSDLNKLFTGTVYTDPLKFEALIKRTIATDQRQGTNRLTAAKVSIITHHLRQYMELAAARTAAAPIEA